MLDFSILHMLKLKNIKAWGSGYVTEVYQKARGYAQKIKFVTTNSIACFMLWTFELLDFLTSDVMNSTLNKYL